MIHGVTPYKTVRVKYALTFTGLSIGAQAVASAAAAGFGLVAAAQQADMGTSTRFPICIHLARMTPDCRQISGGTHNSLLMNETSSFSACTEFISVDTDICLHMLTNLQNVLYPLAERVCGKPGFFWNA